MATGREPFWGFSTYENATDLVADGFKVGVSDVLLNAALHRAWATHTHDGQPNEFSDLDDPLDLAQEAALGAALEPSTTYYYVFTRVDAAGRESAPSPLAEVTTPPEIPAPQAMPQPGLALGEGDLPPGLHAWALTYYTGVSGSETTASAPSVVNIPAGVDIGATLYLPELPEGVDGVNIYRRDPTSSEYRHLVAIAIDEFGDFPESYLDTGATPLSSTRSLPIRNTTSAFNQVTVTLPAGFALAAGETWKLYRATVDDAWDNSLLHHVIEQSGGEVVTSFVDDGLPTQPGKPPESMANYPNPGKVLLTGGAHVQGVLPRSFVEGGGFGYPGAPDAGTSISGADPTIGFTAAPLVNYGTVELLLGADVTGTLTMTLPDITTRAEFMVILTCEDNFEGLTDIVIDGSTDDDLYDPFGVLDSEVTAAALYCRPRPNDTEDDAPNGKWLAILLPLANWTGPGGGGGAADGPVDAYVLTVGDAGDPLPESINVDLTSVPADVATVIIRALHDGSAAGDTCDFVLGAAPGGFPDADTHGLLAIHLEHVAIEPTGASGRLMVPQDSGPNPEPLTGYSGVVGDPIALFAPTDNPTQPIDNGAVIANWALVASAPPVIPDASYVGPEWTQVGIGSGHASLALAGLGGQLYGRVTGTGTIEYQGRLFCTPLSAFPAFASDPATDEYGTIPAGLGGGDSRRLTVPVSTVEVLSTPVDDPSDLAYGPTVLVTFWRGNDGRWWLIAPDFPAGDFAIDLSSMHFELPITLPGS